MPNLPDPYRIAICVSDLHLTLAAPACRADKDWLAVQADYLQQVKDGAKDLPILCAGDIFDRWNASPELINFALKHLPDGMICVPGQHDLPNHRRDLMHRSGYGVLVEAGKIKDISSGHVHCGKGYKIHGFGWEEEITPVGVEQDVLQIALIHCYCWTTGYSYPGAPETGLVSAYKKNLRGYDVAFFGDNHKGFFADAGSCRVMNVGGFIRRKSDELDYRPVVGVLFSDGTVKRRYLDTSKDKFHTKVKEREETPINLKEFIESLEGLGEHGVDFREAVLQHLQKGELDEPVCEIIKEMLEST